MPERHTGKDFFATVRISKSFNNCLSSHPHRIRYCGANRERCKNKDSDIVSTSESLLAPQVGLEPTTLRLTAECSAIELLRNMKCGSDLLSRAVSSQVPSACWGLTSVFGMGTGGTPRPLPPQRVNFFIGRLCTLTTAYETFKRDLSSFLLLVFGSTKSSYRPISIVKLHTLLRFHRRPITW